MNLLRPHNAEGPKSYNMLRISYLSITAVAALLLLPNCSKEPSAPDVPVISTLPVSNITMFAAQGGGDITHNGSTAIMTRGLVWSILENPTIELNNGITAEGSGKVLFESQLTGLIQNTTYYVKAYAGNGLSITYGQQEEF